MTRARGPLVVRWLQRALVLLGVVCLSAYGIVTLRASWYQRAAIAELDARRAAAPTAGVGGSPEARGLGATDDPAVVAKPPQVGELIGRVDIPRLKLSAAIAEGDDDRTLGKAVGPLPDTPFPWQRRGNVALAAHRDGLFRPLEGVRVEDDIVVVTPRGEFQYRVKRTHIVDPDDVWVIAPTDVPTLTLITCYPFSFIGNAPQRFIVQAEMVGPAGGLVVTGKVLPQSP